MAISWTINEAFLLGAARDPAMRDASPEELFLDCLPVPKGIVTAARRRGHDVRALIGNSIVENSFSSRIQTSWMRRLRRMRPIPRVDATLWQSWRDHWLLRWRPDIYIYCGAVPSGRTAARLKQLGTLLVQYTGIYPALLPSDDVVRRGLSAADVAVCNSEGIARQAAELGCRRAHFVYSAYEDSHFRRLEPPTWSQRPYDVGFVGEIGSLHGARRAFLAEVFERCADLKLALHTNTRDLPEVLKKLAQPAGGPRDLPKLLSLSRISLNVQADGAEHETRGVNFRTFEIPAARCTQVMTTQRGIEDIFIPNEDVVCVGSPEEAERRIRGLLASPADAQGMAERACAKVANHTWARRGDQILDICEDEAHSAQGGTR
jgi:glycosyltransferase involved in cell wall biosynthesis